MGMSQESCAHASPFSRRQTCDNEILWSCLRKGKEEDGIWEVSRQLGSTLLAGCVEALAASHVPRT